MLEVLGLSISGEQDLMCPKTRLKLPVAVPPELLVKVKLLETN